jgi:4-alpha-glucanotransferase
MEQTTMAESWINERTSGVLLHPVSLPGPYGIGDIGGPAQVWARLLSQARQTWWQLLPLGPTGFGDSPYQSSSSFAGNPNLLSPDLLVEDGLLDRSELAAWHLPAGRIDYERVIRNKKTMLDLTWERFQRTNNLRSDFDRFRADEAGWLDDFSLYTAIKQSEGERSWTQWPAELAQRKPSALADARRQLQGAMALHQFAQFLFFRQWRRLRDEAARLGVKLIGDVPIYVAFDSADVWANPELFQLDHERKPIVVSGVPPDYFSATGQLWGNPIYDWDRMRTDHFAWWSKRLSAALRLFDVVRLDHFRGIDAYWAVPAGNQTAEHGRWLPGPKDELLTALHQSIGNLPIIAEDLGFITDEVEALRTRFALPGMRILQFAFGGAVEERFLPHRFDVNTIVYTGTHDNDTTQGWFSHLTDAERRGLFRYSPEAERSPTEALIRLAWASVAGCAIVPFQDVLGLGSEARLNTPGTTSDNWRWRAPAESLVPERFQFLRELSEVYQRNTSIR